MSEVMKIDIGAVLAKRMGKRFGLVPRFTVTWLERLICQDQLNGLLEAIGDRRDVEAAEIILNRLNVSLKPVGFDAVPDGRFIFASNHPLGGLDGIALIALLGRRYDNQIRFLVNDLLMAVKPFENIFLPVNKFGKQSRQYATDIDAAFDSTMQMITFPAGLCSRRQPDGTIADPDWRNTFVTRAIRHRRDIIPVFFGGRNSNRFYNAATWRKRLGLKFNIEQVLLPSEVFRSEGAEFEIYFGQPIEWQSLDRSRVKEHVGQIRQMVYQLPRQNA